MGKRREPIKHDTSVEGAVSDAQSEIESLAEEMRSWYDNMPENFQNGDVGSRVSEAADTLEGISWPEAPEAVSSLPVSYTTPSRRRASRRERRDDATCAIDMAISVAREWAETEDAGWECIPESERNRLEGDVKKAGAEMTDEMKKGAGLAYHAEHKDAVEAYADELESAKDEADNVDFPSMRG